MRTNSNRTTLLRRAKAAIVVVALAFGAMAATAAVASAEKVCGPGSGRIICLSVSHQGGGIYEIGVGADFFLPVGTDAAAIIAQPGANFSAILLGRDDDGDDVLSVVPLINEAGFGNQASANFGINVGTGVVNEDNPGKDELVARVDLVDRVNHVTYTAFSPVLNINI